MKKLRDFRCQGSLWTWTSTSSDLSRSVAVYLRSMNFSWVHIAELLGVSRVTLYRRRTELGIQDSDILREMDDDELRRYMGQVREEFPNIGESLVIGRLHSMGYHVPG